MIVLHVLQTYVQTILRKNAADVYRIIVKECGHFYVCGDVKMASDVTATLEEIIMTEGKMSPQDAKDFIRKLQVMYIGNTDLLLNTLLEEDRRRDEKITSRNGQQWSL